MQTFIELLTATFTAGEVKVFEFSGDYFEIIDAPYPLTVELSDRNGGLTGKLSLAEQSFNIKAGFARITLTSPTAQTVRVGYGSGEVGNRRTAGVVSVIDGSQARTRSGIVYGAGMLSAGVAANVSGCQLWNPPGSGKRIICPAVTPAPSTAAASIMIGVSTVNIGGTNQTATTIRSNYSAGGAGIAQAWVNVAATPTLLLPLRSYILAQALGTPFKHEPKMGPYVLEPGSGLVVTTGTGNCDIYAAFEFTEETI